MAEASPNRTIVELKFNTAYAQPGRKTPPIVP